MKQNSPFTFTLHIRNGEFAEEKKVQGISLNDRNLAEFQALTFAAQ